MLSTIRVGRFCCLFVCIFSVVFLSSCVFRRVTSSAADRQGTASRCRLHYQQRSRNRVALRCLRLSSSRVCPHFHSGFFRCHLTARCYTERGIVRQIVCPSVRPSVCLSVTLRYRGHIGWNTSKVFSRLSFFSADPAIADLLQRERKPRKFGRNRGGIDNTRRRVVTYF